MRRIKRNSNSYFKSVFDFCVKENESELQKYEHGADDLKTFWQGISYITILRGLSTLRR